jgi:hypothetical protein
MSRADAMTVSDPGVEQTTERGTLPTWDAQRRRLRAGGGSRGLRARTPMLIAGIRRRNGPARKGLLLVAFLLLDPRLSTGVLLRANPRHRKQRDLVGGA